MRRLLFLCIISISALSFKLNAQCNANFIYITNGLTVDFTDTSYTNTTIASYSWTFGDSGTASIPNPSHTYVAAGSYTVCLTITEPAPSRCTNTFCDVVIVTAPQPICMSGFGYTVRNDSVDFIDSAQNFTNLIYDFGDGDTSIQNNPTHVYDSSGSYNVCLTVFDSLTLCSSTTCKTISITVPLACKAGYTHQAVGDSILFTNTAISYNRIEYDFGDGNTSTKENPYHHYTNSGTYYVKQTVFNDARNCSDTFYDSITVNISTSCFADFEVAIDTSKSKLLFLINYSSSHPNHEYLWTFGDGGTGTGRTPSHLYADYGRYEICLTVKDDTLVCTSTYCDTLGLDSNDNVLKANGFTLQVIDGRPIGIEENYLETQLSIFPNPVSELLTVKLPKTTLTVSYKLLDITGKILNQGNFNQQSNQLDFSNYNSGIYLIQFTDGRNVVVKRVIKR